MTRRLMGMETEYGLGVYDADGRPADRNLVLATMCQAIPDLFPALPGISGGFFISNGSRCYVDCGHPEYCSPELDNPKDVVLYMLAGDAIWRAAADTVLAQSPNLSRVLLFKHNVDYASSHTTWACHESYGHRADPAMLQEHLIPHLVSRIIFCGAGGFDPHSIAIRYVISPRASHIERAISATSTSDRGIFHTKDEPLARGWSRLHVLCGEGLRSQKASYLKLGSTALVVALIEAGLEPGAEVRLPDPVGALHLFASDPTLQAATATVGHGHCTALDMQWHYLACAERYLEHPTMPAWAPEFCHDWRAMLSLLEAGPHAVNRSLDWAIKRPLYDRHCAARGLTPELLGQWQSIVDRLVAVHGTLGENRPFDPELVLAPDSPLRDEVNRLSATLHKAGLSWEGFREYYRLMTELCELDLRFAEIASSGLFEALERLGMLEHHLDGITPETIRRAMRQPPPASMGRAHQRGSFIIEHSQRRAHHCDWHHIRAGDGQFLDLADPFLTKRPPWKASPASPEPDDLRVREVLAQVEDDYARGRYQAASSHIEMLAQRLPALSPGLRVDTNYWLASIRVRSGHYQNALEAFAGTGWDRESAREALGMAFLHRFAGLGPATAMGPIITEINGALAGGGPGDPEWLFVFRDHHAFWLLHQGQVDEARRILLDLFSAEPPRWSTPRTGARIRARALVDLAECERRIGNPDAARSRIQEAERLQISHEIEGDLADFTLATRAKLEGPSREGKCTLKRAFVIQQRLGNEIGLTRTLLLRARMFPFGWRNAGRLERLRLLQRDLPSLRQCRFLHRILEHWNLWVAGKTLEGVTDTFWNL